MGGVGELEREDGRFSQREQGGAGFAADEERREGGQMGLVAHDGEISVVRMQGETVGEIARIVFG